MVVCPGCGDNFDHLKKRGYCCGHCMDDRGHGKNCRRQNIILTPKAKPATLQRSVETKLVVAIAEYNPDKMEVNSATYLRLHRNSSVCIDLNTKKPGEPENPFKEYVFGYLVADPRLCGWFPMSLVKSGGH